MNMASLVYFLKLILTKPIDLDNIPAWVLKELALELTPMIAHLFKQSSELPGNPLILHPFLRKIRDVIHQITGQFP